MIETINLLKENLKNETVVIAVSGGPDSMALLQIVNSLKEKLDLKLVCAHVNHKQRIESEEEAVMVEDYCKQNDIIFEYMTIEDYNKTNFHQDARTKRYNFFEKCVKKCQAKHLLTAHHGDDLMETILMRIVRGASFKSYAGFKDKIEKDEYTILRPLVYYTKEEIENYVKENNIPYRIDQSNNKDKYTRNRYRKYILPHLKNEDKRVHHKFYKFSKTIEAYEEYINKETNKYYQEVFKEEKLNIEKFKILDKIIQIRIINQILFNIYKEDLSLITDKHQELIYNIVTNNKPNQEINLPNKFIGIKTYNEFYIKRQDKYTNYKLELIDKVILPNKKMVEKQSKTNDNSNYTIKLNSKEIKQPLYIRTRQDGDKIEIKGLNGSKKVKDIFINEKVSMQDRKDWPILVDSNDTILWIPGLKKSKFDKQNKENYDIIIKYH